MIQGKLTKKKFSDIVRSGLHVEYVINVHWRKHSHTISKYIGFHCALRPRSQKQGRRSQAQRAGEKFGGGRKQYS